MGGIFISYRREDAAGHAGRLFDRLKARFGKAAVFMDVEGIDAGVDFVERIDAAVGGCEVLLAVIGRNWLEARNAQGMRRLDDARDFVRLETGAALTRGIRVIPVLVEGAQMPAEDALPVPLQGLARRQAVELRDNRWDADVEHLIHTLEPILHTSSAQPAAWRKGSAWLAATAILAFAGLGLGLLWQASAPAPGIPGEAAPAVTAAQPSVPAAVVEPPAPGENSGRVRTVTAPPPSPARPAAAPPAEPPKPPTLPPAAATPQAAAPTGAQPAETAARAEKAEASAQTAVSAAAVAKQPRVVIHALGLPTQRAFWNREQAPAYSARMAALYRERLLEHADGKIEVSLGGPGETARHLLEGPVQAREQACRESGAGTLWVALARQEFAISPADSAHWPELRLLVLACEGGERREQRVNLAPRREDVFPFSTDMGRAMSTFVREHLHLAK